MLVLEFQCDHKGWFSYANRVHNPLCSNRQHLSSDDCLGDGLSELLCDLLCSAVVCILKRKYQHSLSQIASRTRYIVKFYSHAKDLLHKNVFRCLFSEDAAVTLAGRLSRVFIVLSLYSFPWLFCEFGGHYQCSCLPGESNKH